MGPKKAVNIKTFYSTNFNLSSRGRKLTHNVVSNGNYSVLVFNDGVGRCCTTPSHLGRGSSCLALCLDSQPIVLFVLFVLLFAGPVGWILGSASKC